MLDFQKSDIGIYCLTWDRTIYMSACGACGAVAVLCAGSPEFICWCHCLEYLSYLILVYEAATHFAGQRDRDCGPRTLMHQHKVLTTELPERRLIY